MTDTTSPITLLLQDVANGNKDALNELIPSVYSELRRIADGYLRREKKGHTLQPTALINEAYARLVGTEQPDYRNRAHFLGVAAQVMRQILIDHARGKSAQKRGGGQSNYSLDEARRATAQEKPLILMQLSDAIDALERLDGQKAKLVELKFFGGLTAEESAEVLQISVNIVRRDLRFAMAWLQREIGVHTEGPPE